MIENKLKEIENKAIESMKNITFVCNVDDDVSKKLKLHEEISRTDLPRLVKALRITIKLLEKERIRLGILKDRLVGCGKNHELSLFEIDGWIEEIDLEIKQIEQELGGEGE
jgi:hypothetical protein